MRLAVWFHSGHFLSRSSFLNSQVAFDCRLFSFLFNKNENGLWPVILSRFHPTPFEFRDHLGGIFHQEDPRRLPAIFAGCLKEFLFFTQIIRRFPPFCRIFAGFFWPGFPVVSLYSRRTFRPFFCRIFDQDSPSYPAIFPPFWHDFLIRIPRRFPLFWQDFGPRIHFLLVDFGRIFPVILQGFLRRFNKSFWPFARDRPLGFFNSFQGSLWDFYKDF